MDDGFQAVALARDENILLIDATNPFGNGHLVPRGILREPLAAMKRATAIMLTRRDQAQDKCEAIEQTIKQHAPGVPITRTRHKPTGLWRVCDGSEVPLSFLQDTTIRVVCGIGNPDAFTQTLRELGATIAETHPLPDHGQIPDSLLDATLPTIMTEKDAMRVSNVTSLDVYVLAIALEISE
jgi:tetraacyldisaccharide 4'-kinase